MTPWSSLASWRAPPGPPNALTKEWTTAAAGLGVDVGLHALWHTQVSALISKGVPITMISYRLGHASPNVTLAVYAHMFEKTDAKAAEAMNDALAGLLTS
jgi:integrase